MTFFNQEKLFDVPFLKQCLLNASIDLHSRFTKFSSRNNMESNPMLKFLMIILKRPKGPYGTSNIAKFTSSSFFHPIIWITYSISFVEKL